MINYILIAIILLCVGSATFYIIKTKKKGTKCIGCPDSKNCTKMACNCHPKHKN